MSERPYPEGTAWDEAWLQRRRADRLEQLAIAVVRAAMIGDQNFVPCLLRDDEGLRLRRRILELADYLREGSEMSEQKDPGNGWRWLVQGDVIQAQDEVFDEGRWRVVRQGCVGNIVVIPKAFRRRGDKSAQQPAPQPTVIEAIVCRDIAERQQAGIAKYGTTVGDNPLSLRGWLNHAYEECLDQAIYLRRAIAEIDTYEQFE